MVYHASKEPFAVVARENLFLSWVSRDAGCRLPIFHAYAMRVVEL